MTQQLMTQNNHNFFQKLSGIQILTISISAIIAIILGIGIFNAFTGNNDSNSDTTETTARVEEEQDNTITESKTEELETTNETQMQDKEGKEDEDLPTLPNTGNQESSLDSNVELLYESAFTEITINEPFFCGSSGEPATFTNTKTQYKGATSTLTVINQDQLENYDSEDVTLFYDVVKNGGDDVDLTSLRSRIMERSCSGFGTSIFAELDTANRSYPNVDGFRAYLVTEGQSLSIQPRLLLFAQKGDSLIGIEYNFPEGQINTPTSDDLEKCPATGAPVSFSCLEQLIVTPENLAAANNALGKITEDYQLKGDTEFVKYPGVTTPGTQTVALQTSFTYSRLLDNGGSESGSVFIDSLDRLYVIKNVDSIDSVLESSTSTTPGEFVITANFIESNELIETAVGAQISYEIKNLEGYTYSY